MARAHPSAARLGAPVPADARASSAGEKLTRILILADDLTGAADAAAAFLGRARKVSVFLDENKGTRSGVCSVDLDTRVRSERSACAIVRKAFASRAARDASILFKKIDSTLRGHVAAELAAARGALGRARPVVLAPAFPAQRRIVRNGRLYVRGVALPGSLRERFALDGILVPDCASDADLDRIARAGLALRPRPLFVGSAGLARAIARTLPRAPTARRPRIREAPVITVVGSPSPVSLRQARRLGRRDTLLRPESLRRLPRGAHYVLTGGATARAVLGRLGIGELRLLGEVEPGVPFGIAPDGTLVCTKAGGFGSAGTLLRCVRRLKREMKRR
jgi:4-hydroxythreonine-4-phosphate dehydrogenase